MPGPSTGRVRWPEQVDHVAWLAVQTQRQLAFGQAFPHPAGGSWYLDDTGRPDTSRPVHTWVTARMLHVYCVGHLAGIPGCAPLARQALAGLTGPLHDDVHGGWFASVGPDGQRDETKGAYPHAFVVFASSSAAVADLPGARALLDDALTVFDERFWEPGPGLHSDSAVRDWSRGSPYRGVNANMHAVEALLAAADTTGDRHWRDRARRITETVLDWAAANDWRVPSISMRTGRRCRSIIGTTRRTPLSRTARRSATAWSGRGWPCRLRLPAIRPTRRAQLAW